MPHWSQSDHPPSCQGQTTDHRPCAVGRPYWRWSIGSLEIWVLSFSLWDPRTPAGAEKGISCFMEPMGQGAKAWGRGLGKGNVVSVCEKFPFSGKMGKIQSYKGARDLHRSQRRIEERRHGPHIPELSQSSERPVSSSLAMGCPTPNQPCQERSYQPPPPSSPLRQVLASAGMRQTPSGVPLVSQQHPPPAPPPARLLSGLPAAGGCCFGRAQTPCWRLACSQSLLVRPTFPSPGEPWELGTHSRAGSARICCSVCQAIRTHSSPSSLGGVDSNSRAELPSWQENRATVRCGRRRGGEQPAGGGLGQTASLLIPPVWQPASCARRGDCARRWEAPGEARGGGAV